MRGGHGNRHGHKQHNSKERKHYDYKQREGIVEQNDQKPTRKERRPSQIEQCIICTEDIEYYAIGECGHNVCCWSCILRQRIKMGQEKCPMCKEINLKVLISSDKEDSMAKNKYTLCDPELDIYFEDIQCKNFIMQHLGYYCQMCKKSKNEVRKFPAIGPLEDHLDKYHRMYHCNLCLEEKPVLLFEQTLYKWGPLNKHKNFDHP